MQARAQLTRPQAATRRDGATGEAASAVAPGRSNRASRRRIALGAVDHVLEREADRAAEAVLTEGRTASLSTARPAAIQRMCASCEEEREEEDDTLRRKEAVATQAVGEAAIAEAARAVESPGTPLGADLRSYFEPRFGRDLSHVRLHTGGGAARSARAINARAFTLGRDIAFASGEYRPQTDAGRRLLAHELAHVAQQSRGAVGGVIRRQAAAPAPPFHSRRDAERSGGGTTDFVETVQNQPTVGADGRVSGRVRRSEIAPAAGGQPEEEIHSDTVDVVFDPSTCTVEVPYRINFVAAAQAGAQDICADPPPATPVANVSGTRLAEIGDEVVTRLNSGLRGWYSLEITGCEHDCAGQEIEVVPKVERSANNPDTTIDVVNRGGRADAGTICARDFNPGTTLHEGGHQVLGHGDEYREQDAALRRRVPQWARDERVRSDVSIMGSHHAAGRFALFHERHFRFAQVFMEAVLQGEDCMVEMNAEPRWTPDFRISGFIGGFDTNAGAGFTGGGGIDVSLLHTRERELELFVGAHALYHDAPARYRDLVLLGARLGLRAQTGYGNVGVVGELFGEAGASIPLDPRYGEPTGPGSVAPYVSGGAGVRLRSPVLGGGVRLDIGAELLVGTELRREEVPTLLEEEGARRWIGGGVNLGLAF